MAGRSKWDLISIGPDPDRPQLERMQLLFEAPVISTAVSLEPADLLQLQAVVNAKVAELDG